MHSSSSPVSGQTIDNSSQKKLKRDSELKEIKYSLRDLIDETDAEKQASNMSRQIVDQTEIQKMLKDFEKKSRG